MRPRFLHLVFFMTTCLTCVGWNYLTIYSRWSLGMEKYFWHYFLTENSCFSNKCRMALPNKYQFFQNKIEKKMYLSCDIDIIEIRVSLWPLHRAVGGVNRNFQVKREIAQQPVTHFCPSRTLCPVLVSFVLHRDGFNSLIGLYPIFHIPNWGYVLW